MAELTWERLGYKSGSTYNRITDKFGRDAIFAVCEDYDSGLTYRKIAEKYDVSNSTIARWLDLGYLYETIIVALTIMTDNNNTEC